MAKNSYKHPLRLTDEEKDYIDNHTALTINQVREKLGRTFNIVKRYIVEKKLPYHFTSSGRPVNKEFKKRLIKTHTPAKVVEFKRPPATYSNIDWEKYYNQKYGNNQMDNG